jgi:hypothetical protein
MTTPPEADSTGRSDRFLKLDEELDELELDEDDEDE